MSMLRYALVALLSLVSFSSWAQDPESASKAEAALRQMRDGLIEARELEFTTQFHVVDTVLGQEKKGAVEYKIRKPNLLRVTASLPTGKVVLISDGKTLTIHHLDERIYEQYPAPDSVVGSIYLAAGLLVEQTSLVDFFWTVDYLAIGGDAGRFGLLKSKTFGDKECEGFVVERAFEVWNVWLDRSSALRPCYVTTKFTGGGSVVIHTNSLHWRSKSEFSAETFLFKAPAGHARKN